MLGKIIASVVSLLLVVGIVIGLVLNGHGHKNEQTPSSTSMKEVTTFCEPTTYKDLCAKSVGEAVKNGSTNGKDFLLAAFKATLVELEATKEKARSVKVDKSQDLYHFNAVVKDCPELVDYALDALNASITMIGNNDVKSTNDNVDELLNFLGGVNAFQTTCLDSFQDAELKKQIQDILTSANQLTDNAINIVASMSQISKSLNVSIPDSIKSNSQRRLLAVHGEANDGYPSWFPAADRELLRNLGRRRLPNAVVAKDGSGQFRTITDAINAMPNGFRGRYIIYVKAGIYEEKVFIDKTKPFVLIHGDGPGKTIVTGSDNFGIKKIPTWKTATFASVATGVVIKSMTIHNTAGPDGHQAVALRVQGDMTAVFDCSIEGFQDTLYYHTFRQFYRNCAIFGTVDFIFGQGSAMIQTSTIVVRKPGPSQSNTVTADGNEKNNLNVGLVIHVSRIVPELALMPQRFTIKTYLGRPWKAFSTTILLRCELGDFIRPEGWLQWQGEGFHNTANYGEFANVGPGARTNMRDKSFKRWRVLSPQEANRYTLASFISDLWLRRSTVPFISGMY